ncbi:unnamed protein product [Scytosiphon promiscuus]
MGAERVALFRACLRAVKRMPSADQRATWHHYTRLKFAETGRVHDRAKAQQLFKDGWEEVNQMNYYSDVRESSALEIATRNLAFTADARTSDRTLSGQSNTRTREPAARALGAPRLNDRFLDSWLVRVLPGTADADREACAATLAAGGFESQEMLAFLREEDLSSLKVAHQRAILQAVAELRLTET